MGPSGRGRHSHSFDIWSGDILIVSHVSDNTRMFVAKYLLSKFSNLRPSILPVATQESRLAGRVGGDLFKLDFSELK